MPLVGRHCALINCTGRSTRLAKDLPRPALASAMELIRNPVCPPDHPTNEESREGRKQNAEEVCLEPVWLGRLRPSDPAALAGAPKHGGGAGEVWKRPLADICAVAAGQEIQMGTLSTGRKEVRRFRNAMATLVTFTESFFLLGQ